MAEVESKNVHGTCNCGQVKVQIRDELKSHVCHCTICRKHTGSTSFTALEVPIEEFAVTLGKDKLKKYTPTRDEGDETPDFRATRYWCNECGSSIYLTVGPLPFAFVGAGLFTPGTIPAPKMHMFAKHIESWERTTEGADIKQEMEGLG